MFGYELIVADPPWDFENYSEAGTGKGADPHYSVMSLAEIKALPVGDLARGDCLLLLWATGCMLPLALQVMESWGFTYKSEIVWRKTTVNGKVRIGTGYRVRTMHEPVLVGTMGNPHHKPFPSLIDGLAREHSRKPDEFYEAIDRCCPSLGFRADLFARTRRPGFDSWGDEVGKFDPLETSNTGAAA
ncbi:MT-A70 family methyltransferase [Methyloceanibacter caenitepidi]|uniref:Adenine-specific DNA methyltransferase n=1 Tax=Methyloceanibacter caenitepidi TaxID=1384459 RepID=A0A0A8K5Z8_9HYPH|nr:MT-A70 family methyltransferase [Methyloceanibacter caenitepidi]BAQ18335.1 adenine-specific DNA methyltransferase [Methyloceanibacter caenitepidi]